MYVQFKLIPILLTCIYFDFCKICAILISTMLVTIVSLLAILLFGRLLKIKKISIDMKIRMDHSSLYIFTYLP